MKKYLLPIQFTKLTREDMVTYRDCYMCLLIGQTRLSPGKRIEELRRALHLFYEAFK